MLLPLRGPLPPAPTAVIDTHAAAVFSVVTYGLGGLAEARATRVPRGPALERALSEWIEVARRSGGEGPEAGAERDGGARDRDGAGVVVDAVRAVLEGEVDDGRGGDWSIGAVEGEFVQVVCAHVGMERESPFRQKDPAAPEAVRALDDHVASWPLARVFATGVSVFLTMEDPTFTSVLGHPGHTEVYPNHAGFNAAVTLRRLIREGPQQASSMQARLLARGVLARTFPLSVWGEPLFARAAVLGEIESHGTQESWARRAPAYGCPSACARGQEACAAGQLCSPSHGCYEAPEDDSLFPGNDPRLEEMRAAERQSLNDEEMLAAGLVDPLVGLVGNVTAEGQREEQVERRARPKPHVHDGTGGIMALEVSPGKFPRGMRASPVPLLPGPPPSPPPRLPAGPRFVVKGSVPVRAMAPGQNFSIPVAESGLPVILRATPGASFPALSRWASWDYLARGFASNASTSVLEAVKTSPRVPGRPSLFFDPDTRAPGAKFPSLDTSLAYESVNMSADSFFAAVGNDSGPYVYYFGTVPEQLRADVEPSRSLYLTDFDHGLQKQFLWVSSEGVNTHTHFDQDHNFFLQVAGRKRFVLARAHSHRAMHLFPRTHPMWHKSRLRFLDPDLPLFPDYEGVEALEAELGPGDVLYVPPMTYHYVETLSASVSLSTWSHDMHLYRRMRTIYRHDHKFDMLKSRLGRVYALRLFVDMLIHRVVGFRATARWANSVLRSRFVGLEAVYPPSRHDETLCESPSRPGEIPISHSLYGDATLDAELIGGEFTQLHAVARDVLLADYVEEMAAEVLGAERVYAFFRYCFKPNQRYYYTKMEDQEHTDLWG